ncbi:uncharacterized protein METZ01_LOCUS347718, partial [marine metagenome]
NFDYEMSPNVGLDWGSYQQIYEKFKFTDDDIIFFTHDDIIIKSWDFANLCIEQVGEKFDIIGNGQNYLFYLDPDAIITPGNKNEYRPFAAIKTWKEVAVNKEFFDKPLQCMTVRGSFICTTGEALKKLNGFEWFSDPYDGKNPDLQWGNIMVNLNGYKFTKTFGTDRIAYMSAEYANSDFISELARGGE